MPLLPNDQDPFAKASVYRDLGLDPFADTDTVNARAALLTDEVELLPEEQRARRREEVQDALRTLRSTRLRILINAVVLDPLNHRRIVELLREIGTIDPAALQLPALDLQQVLHEGEHLALMTQDFGPLAPEAALQLDAAELQRLLQAQPAPKMFQWDV